MRYVRLSKNPRPITSAKKGEKKLNKLDPRIQPVFVQGKSLRPYKWVFTSSEFQTPLALWKRFGNGLAFCGPRPYPRCWSCPWKPLAIWIVTWLVDFRISCRKPWRMGGSNPGTKRTVSASFAHGDPKFPKPSCSGTASIHGRTLWLVNGGWALTTEPSPGMMIQVMTPTRHSLALSLTIGGSFKKAL